MSYTCATCKNTFSGTPAITNAAGTFCPDCEAERQEKSRLGHKAMRDSITNCVWCGDPLGGQERGGIHRECEYRRDWVLKCIRHSTKMAEYVAKTESREAPMREARKQALEKQALEKPSDSGKTEARLARLELLLGSLAEALGVKEG